MMNGIFEKLRLEKEQARERDQQRLESGVVTGDELQADYSLIPMDLARNPGWRAERLEQAARGLNRPKARPTVPDHLLKKEVSHP